MVNTHRSAVITRGRSKCPCYCGAVGDPGPEERVSRVFSKRDTPLAFSSAAHTCCQ